MATEPTIHNRTSLSLSEIEKLPLLASTVSKWRNRNIKLYQHPDQPDHVISVGLTFDKRSIICVVETKSTWHLALEYAERGKLYIYE